MVPTSDCTVLMKDDCEVTSAAALNVSEKTTDALCVDELELDAPSAPPVALEPLALALLVLVPAAAALPSALEAPVLALLVLVLVLLLLLLPSLPSLPLLSHGCVLHTCDAAPTHAAPPLEGLGLIHARVCVPLPHVAEHAPKSVHPPSTGTGVSTEVHPPAATSVI